jgi:hypothetical protein
MTWRAGLNALRHIGWVGFGFLGRRQACAQEEKTECQEDFSYAHYVSPKHNHVTVKNLDGDRTPKEITSVRGMKLRPIRVESVAAFEGSRLDKSQESAAKRLILAILMDASAVGVLT